MHIPSPSGPDTSYGHQAHCQEECHLGQESSHHYSQTSTLRAPFVSVRLPSNSWHAFPEPDLPSDIEHTVKILLAASLQGRFDIYLSAETTILYCAERA